MKIQMDPLDNIYSKKHILIYIILTIFATSKLNLTIDLEKPVSLTRLFRF